MIVAEHFSVANSLLVDGFGLLVGALLAQRDFSAVIIVTTAEQCQEIPDYLYLKIY